MITALANGWAINRWLSLFSRAFEQAGETGIESFFQCNSLNSTFLRRHSFTNC